MPSLRFFTAFALVSMLFIAGAIVDGLHAVGMVADAVLLVALFVDARWARSTPARGSRQWPPLLVQGSTAEVEVVIESMARRELRLLVRDGLHPGLASHPVRHRLTIPAGATATWRFGITPLRRGAHRVLPVTVRILGPLGLAWSQRDLVESETRRVYPQIRWRGALGRLLVLAQRRQLGAVRTAFRGHGSDTYGLREYLVGDPPKSIHWKATARHGRLIVRDEVLERRGRLIILLDCGRAMASTDGNRSKLDHALASALAVVRVAAARGDHVSLAAFDNRVRRVARIRGGGREVSAAYRTFYDLEASLNEPAYDVACDLVASLERRSTTVMLFTSVIDLAAAELLTRTLQRLRRHHRPLLVNLEDPVLGRLALGRPDNPAEAFAKVAGLGILLANRRLASRLRRSGVRTAAAPADRLAVRAVEGYLALSRYRGALGAARHPRSAQPSRE
jgi:uncharacterized protein (DUF58 family)